MPGLKRRTVDDEETEVSSFSSEGSRPTLDKGTGKRVRLSVEPQPEDQSSTTSDKEIDLQEAVHFQKRQEVNEQRKNVAAENGIIESITCTNFMCHGFLHVDIGPLINFVIGHNGSGKSAVLTALTISLGGKASATNRGGSLKSFIKEGEDTCTLSVKIKNAGDLGYRTDIYGDTIIVERSFNRAGASGFKLKSSTGRVMSTRRGDLEEISDYYALQLDNPISVLNQDMARNFLSSSTPETKYKFFVKGVQLEQLHHDYQLLIESINQAEGTFEDKRAQVAHLEERKAKAKELLDLLSRQDHIRAKMKALGNQMAWSQVEDEEKNLEVMDHSLREAERTIEQLQQGVNESRAALIQADQVRDQANDNIIQAEKSKEPLVNDAKQCKDSLEVKKGEAIELQAQQRQIGNEIHNRNNAIAKANSDIEEEKQRLEALHGGAHARRLAELEERKVGAQTAKLDYQKHCSRIGDLEERQKDAKLKVEDYKRARATKAQKVDEGETRLEDLERGQKRSGYHSNMESLLKSIQSDENYMEKPVGPIGDYIRLTTPLWSSILEKSFGNVLNGFIVTSKQDQERLSEITKKLSLSNSSPIYISNTQTLDISQNVPDEHYNTVLRVLRVGDFLAMLYICLQGQIDHPLVLRQLIINNAIEQTVLIERMNEARSIMNHTRIRNIRQCYSIHHADPNAGMRFAYGLDGTISSSYMDPYKGIPRMKIEVRDQINFERDTLRRLKSELREHEERHRQLQGILEDCNKAIARHAKEAKTLKIALQRADDEVDRIQDGLDKDAVEEGRLEVLKEGLVKSQEEKTTAENMYQECVNAKDTHQADMKLLLEKSRKATARQNQAEAEIKVLRKALDEAVEARGAVLVRHNEAHGRLEVASAHQKELEDQRTQQAERVAQFQVQARQICARVAVDPGETTTSLDQKLAKLQTDIERYEQRLGGDKQKIAEDYAGASKSCSEASLELQREEALLQLLKSTYWDRQFRWEQFRKHITARARTTFLHFLSHRSFHGKLTINHKDRLLDLNVQPDETQKDRQGGRQAKTLSGGEKSFSQICLLLSLWEAVGAPIRCLDEFDVYMDSVNREASIKLLIRAARDSPGRQFILITPQSMASVDRERDIKIIKMHDPARNQTTIGFPRV